MSIRGSPGELIVANPSGVWRARSVQRRPEPERWDSNSVGVVRWVPRAVSEADPEVGGEKLEARGHPEARGRDRERDGARFSIRREDLERHRFSARCPDCKAILRGTARQDRSEECRSGRHRGKQRDGTSNRAARRWLHEAMLHRIERRAGVVTKGRAVPHRIGRRAGGVTAERHAILLRIERRTGGITQEPTKHSMGK